MSSVRSGRASGSPPVKCACSIPAAGCGKYDPLRVESSEVTAASSSDWSSRRSARAAVREFGDEARGLGSLLRREGRTILAYIICLTGDVTLGNNWADVRGRNTKSSREHCPASGELAEADRREDQRSGHRSYARHNNVTKLQGRDGTG